MYPRLFHSFHLFFICLNQLELQIYPTANLPSFVKQNILLVLDLVPPRRFHRNK